MSVSMELVPCFISSIPILRIISRAAKLDSGSRRLCSHSLTVITTAHISDRGKKYRIYRNRNR